MMQLDKTNTLVIVPALNEQDSIVFIIEELRKNGFSFVVIDDGSIDETRKRSLEAGARTISMPVNAGVGGAVKCGLKFSLANGYSAVIQFDADGQHPASDLNNLIEHANRSGCDMVIASRFKCGNIHDHNHFVRKSALKILSSISQREGLDITDSTSGMRLIRANTGLYLTKKMPRYYLGDTFEANLIAHRGGFKIQEICSTFSLRTAGKPSQSYFQLVVKVCEVIFKHYVSPKKLKNSQNNSY